MMMAILLLLLLLIIIIRRRSVNFLLRLTRHEVIGRKARGKETTRKTET
jgi:hypothetical protein